MIEQIIARLDALRAELVAIKAEEDKRLEDLQKRCIRLQKKGKAFNVKRCIGILGATTTRELKPEQLEDAEFLISLLEGNV